MAAYAMATPEWGIARIHAIQVKCIKHERARSYLKIIFIHHEE